MFNLFLILLLLGTGLVILAGVLYFVWNIADAVDEVSGKKRKRQIEKLQQANMSLGNSDNSNASTTQLVRDSEEDEVISGLIRNAHNVSNTTGSIGTGDVGNNLSIGTDSEDDDLPTGIEISEDGTNSSDSVRDVGNMSSEMTKSTSSVRGKVVVIDEISNMSFEEV